jgi:hypothetical protein
MSARYCTGYLGHIGVPRDPAPIDFSAWFEVFLGGRWYTFDARRNQPHRYCAEPRPLRMLPSRPRLDPRSLCDLRS